MTVNMFDRVQREVLAHTAMRGNVETELADEEATQDTGCWCAYPDWVGDAFVIERSNRILNRLRSVTTAKLRLGARRCAIPTQSLRRFILQWPEGTDAYASYFSWILAGPAYTADQVIRQEN